MELHAPNDAALLSRTAAVVLPADNVLQEHEAMRLSPSLSASFEGEKRRKKQRKHMEPSLWNRLSRACVSLKNPRLRRVFVLSLLVITCLTGVFATALYIAYASLVNPASLAAQSSEHSVRVTGGKEDASSFDFIVQDPVAIPDYPDSPNMPNLKNAFKKTFRIGKDRGGSSKEEQKVIQQEPDLESKPKLPSYSKLSGDPEIGKEVVLLTDHERKDGTYPRLCVLSDGTILGSFTRITGREHALIVTASDDGGKSFHEIGEITRGPGDIDNAFLAEIKEEPSTILAAFRNHDIDAGGMPTHFRITVCGSSDGGKTWTFFSQAAEAKPPYGVWEPYIRVGIRGDVQLTYSQEFSADDQHTMLVSSPNRGLSWSKPVNVDKRTARLRDGMCGIAQTKDTANGQDILVMVIETTRFGGKFNIEGMLSYDDGWSYDHRHLVYNPTPEQIMRNQGRSPHDKRAKPLPDIFNAGAPQVASFGVDGSLICVFMTDDDAPEEKVGWTRNAAIKAVFAPPPHNGTVEWGPPVKIADAESYWPGVTAINDQTVMVTYDYGGGPRATFVTYNL